MKTNVVPLGGSRRLVSGMDPAAFLAGQSPNALVLPSGLSAEDWELIGDGIALITNAQPWWIGDWINYRLEVVRQGRPVETERASLLSEAAERTGLSQSHLKATLDVARNFSRERRRPRLPWKVHLIVAFVNDEADRERLLDWAEEPLAHGGRARGYIAVREHGQSLGLIPVRESRRLRPKLPPISKATQGAVRDLEHWINQGIQLRDFFKSGATAAKAARACETWVTADHVGPLAEFLATIEDTLRNRAAE